MNAIRPLPRLQYAEKEMDRYREDVEAWKLDHAHLSRDCWPWEDLIAKAVFMYERILLLDEDLREAYFAGAELTPESFAAHENSVRTLLQAWTFVSAQLEPHVRRLIGTYGEVAGGKAFFQSLEEAKAILTPDDKFFVHHKLVELRDDAIDAHRAGELHPVFDDACDE